ncbi:hypothetical protein [Caballeronia sp. CLC5]|nr:hypothetical protein [Caballeronia sp. CLC5]
MAFMQRRTTARRRSAQLRDKLGDEQISESGFIAGFAMTDNPK